MATTMNRIGMKCIEPTVANSAGPSRNPYSHYSTSSAVGLDLKHPLLHVPVKEAATTAFARNNVPSQAPDPKGDDKASRMLSTSRSNFSSESSMWGERANHMADSIDDPQIASALALARAKRHNTGFKSNSDAFRAPADQLPDKQHKTFLHSQKTLKDPILRENDLRGPAPNSTTSRAFHAEHKTTDIDCMEDAELDLNERRVVINGAVKNQATTVHHVPHDGWAPISEMKSQYGNRNTATSDAQLAMRMGPDIPSPEEVPPPVAAYGLKRTGLPIVDRVRQVLYERAGGAGVHALTRMLRMMDDNGNHKLNQNELAEGLMAFGLELNPFEIDEIMRFFDKDRSGLISITEFLVGVRGRMSDARRKLVRMAYNQLDINGDEQVTLGEIAQLYDASNHPDVLRGVASPEEIYARFASDWDHDGDHVVTFEEFADYYDDISAGIDEDDYFELMMRNAWHISGGQGVTACTVGRRVFVLHDDGRQSVETLKNDLRINPSDKEAMLQNLMQQGILDIASISLMEGPSAAEPGDLQRAFFQNRNIHAAQGQRGNWFPFRNSTLSTYDLQSANSCGNAIKDTYPRPLHPQKVKEMSIKDPVEHSVYMNKNPMQTTHAADFMPRKHPNRTSLEEVVYSNPGALDNVGKGPQDPQTLARMLTGRPNKEMRHGGYAINNAMPPEPEAESFDNPRKLHPGDANSARVGKRLACEPHNKTTIYKSDYSNQFKVPLDSLHVPSITKSKTGFAYDNVRQVMPDPADETERKRTLINMNPLKKLGIPVVDHVRQKIYERGGSGGFRSLTRILRVMDDDGNRQLDRYEFQQGLQAYGINLSSQDMDQLMKAFDVDGSGYVSITEFLRQLRGPMSERRTQLVKMAFNMLDTDRSGECTMRELLNIYDCTQHPEVLHQRKTAEQVMQEAVSSWDRDGDHVVRFSEFMDYYADISAGIDADDYFELMMRNCWHLSSGSPKSGRGGGRQILVTHNNGRTSVEHIRNDLGTPMAPDRIEANLRAQGISDIKSFKPL